MKIFFVKLVDPGFSWNWFALTQYPKVIPPRSEVKWFWIFHIYLHSYSVNISNDTSLKPPY